MSHPNESSFDTLTAQISSLPLWIKQVIYMKLRQDLENSLAKSTMNSFGENDTLQLLQPELTPAGQLVLVNPSAGYSSQMESLLRASAQGKNVLAICLSYQWTLETCALLLQEAIEKTWIVLPESGVVRATIRYLANQIRLGEYLVQIGRLSVAQLDQALQTQEYIREALGENSGIGNVLINLGYITKEDAEGILFLKEESKKTCPDLSGMLSGNRASTGNEQVPPPASTNSNIKPAPDPFQTAKAPGANSQKSSFFQR